MDCGSEDLVCHAIDWLSSHSHAVQQTFGLIDSAWNHAGGRVLAFLKEHGEKLIALASFSFAVWRWWIYRERILHKRLEEYIQQSDRRLRPAALAAMEAMLRPGRTATLRQPAFAIELREILDRTAWRSFFGLSTIERQTEKQLARALNGLRKRQRIARTAMRSLQHQQAWVHLLAGAVAASRGRCKSRSSNSLGSAQKALREFRRVLEIPGHPSNVEARECEAFELLRLREHDLAMKSYIVLEELARNIDEDRKRDLITARSRRFRAQILQAKARSSGARNAWSLIAYDNNPMSALKLREKHAPFAKWDAIEQGEIHYVAAFIANRCGWGPAEQRQLSKASAAYGEVLAQLPTHRPCVLAATRRLKSEARAGRERIRRAQEFGEYDLDWLMV